MRVAIILTLLLTGTGTGCHSLVPGPDGGAHLLVEDAGDAGSPDAGLDASVHACDSCDAGTRCNQQRTACTPLCAKCFSDSECIGDGFCQDAEAPFGGGCVYSIPQCGSGPAPAKVRVAVLQLFGCLNYPEEAHCWRIHDVDVKTGTMTLRFEARDVNDAGLLAEATLGTFGVPESPSGHGWEDAADAGLWCTPTIQDEENEWCHSHVTGIQVIVDDPMHNEFWFSRGSGLRPPRPVVERVYEVLDSAAPIWRDGGWEWRY